jgi:heme-degrading monooxygenase HmoA
MLCTLTIVRYPKYFGWVGFLSMALFRLPLWLNKNIGFWKLMGCGKNGTFDKTPDWRQWAVLQIGKGKMENGKSKIENGGKEEVKGERLEVKEGSPLFMRKWWQFFGCEVWTLVLEPIESHGTWDGKQCFGQLPKQTDYEGIIAVLTRATIRLNRLSQFWKHVDSVASQMAGAAGFITSVGIGEVPWIKQATFSIWESKAAMKAFAYSMKEHKEVIKKTHQENWYSEDMFTRFKVVASYGTINGSNPLATKP